MHAVLFPTMTGLPRSAVFLGVFMEASQEVQYEAVFASAPCPLLENFDLSFALQHPLQNLNCREVSSGACKREALIDLGTESSVNLF